MLHSGIGCSKAYAYNKNKVTIHCTRIQTMICRVDMHLFANTPFNYIVHKLCFSKLSITVHEESWG